MALTIECDGCLLSAVRQRERAGQDRGLHGVSALERRVAARDRWDRSLRCGHVHTREYWSPEGIDFMTATHAPPLDVLSLMDVLEHLPYPVAALERAHRRLGDGGVTGISLPDSTSASRRIVEHQGANPWPEPEHHHCFSRAPLASLLERCGFAVADIGIAHRRKAQIEVCARKAPAAR